MATGAAQKAQFDAQRRPITAGGLVKTGPIVFEDVTEKAGLSHWRNTTGTPQKKVIIEAKPPYKNAAKDGVSVTDGQAADAGQIALEK